jgi:WD40 repeat protein
MQISLDGRLLMATSNDQSAALYDVATGIRLGDPIATRAPLAYAAFLSPDGRSLAVADAGGVVVWDLDPEHLLAAACRVAGRNLTRTEWSTYLDGPHQATCPVFRARA